MTLQSIGSEIALRGYCLSDRLLNNRNKMASVVCKMFEISPNSDFDTNIVSLTVSLSISEALHKCNLFHHSDSRYHNSCFQTQASRKTTVKYKVCEFEEHLWNSLLLTIPTWLWLKLVWFRIRWTDKWELALNVCFKTETFIVKIFSSAFQKCVHCYVYL